MLVQLAFLLSPLVASTFCGGDFTEIQEGPRLQRHLLSRSSTLAPIRLNYYYYNFTLNSTTLETQFKTILIKLVDSFFTTTLKVYPIIGNLTLSSTKCLSSVIVPTEHQSLGVPGTDVIVYITSNNSTTATYVAFAGSCELDTNALGNVVAGTVVINVPNFSDNSMEAWLANMVHEMSHMLGFSSGLFQYWRNSSGQVYSAVTKNVTIRGVSKNIIITPNVLEKARIAFNCSTLEGLELEELGTGGAHWDKRIMMNDYMTAYIPTEPIFSNITLALFKDTGWYEVDYTLAQMPYFARFAGCSFFDTKCLVDQTSVNSTLWCSEYVKWGCDYFALNKGGCNVKNYTSDISTEFQYFNTTVLGGGDKYADYCPYNQPLTNGDCRGGAVETFTFTNSKEVIGQKSRCFESTLMLKPYSTSNPVYAACYEVLSCNSTSATIYIYNTTVVCPFDGSQMTLTGFNGYFRCPKNNMVCQDIPCKSMCYARGTCSGRGVCNCFPGFGGDFCNVTCSNFCKECSLTSNCTSCLPGFSFFSDRCCPISCLSCDIDGFCLECEQNFKISSTGTCDDCIEGYYKSSNLCIKCSYKCTSCTSAIQCNSCETGYQVDFGFCALICPVNCVSCLSNTFCLECSTGFTPDLNGQCSCQTSFYATDDVCFACKNECLLCSSYSNCLSCMPGYGLQDGSCLLCNTGCSRCITPDYCTTCIKTYYLSQNTCISCPKGCYTCLSESYCTRCYLKYTLSDNQCLPCETGCYKCSSTSDCNVCLTGYYLQDGDCLNCDSSCSACSNLNYCTDCNAGYFLSNNECLSCQIGCIWCSNNTYCFQCSTGSYLLNGTCFDCPDGCLKCLNDSYCTACDYGYGYKSYSCLSCIDGCKKCSTLSTCRICFDGYYLYLMKCFKCSDNCKTCLSYSQCTECLSGTSLQDGYCV